LYTLLMKMPTCLADLVCGTIIYKIAAKKLSGKAALFLSGAYLFCPAVIINSAIWGQIDSLCAMLLLVSLLFLSKDRLVTAAVIYGISIAVKPQLLIFAPIYLFYTLYRKNFKGLFLGLSAALGSILLIATPFTQNFDYLWLIDRYKSTIDSYAYYTVNAYNLWGLLGQNWAPLPENPIAVFILNWTGPLLAAILCGVLMWKAKSKTVIFIAPALLMSTVFIFAAKMHERYLFPVLFSVLITYILTKDKRFLVLFGGFSAVHFLNVSIVMEVGNTWVSPWSAPIMILSFLHIALYVYLLYLIFVVFMRGEKSSSFDRGRFTKELRTKKFTPEKKRDRNLHRGDLLAIGAVTALYAVVAFWNLGAFDTANTSWLPRTNESVILETGEKYSSLTYLPGVSQKGTQYSRVGAKVSVDVSDDGENWVAAGTPNAEGTYSGTLEENFDYVYSWREFPISNGKKYIRLTPQNDEAVINEIALKSGDGTRFIALLPVSGDTAPLLDEHETVPLYPSYYNSTYFDEIYHARTAYEHTLGLEAYENTHPTLGKLIIALSIKIFGMNPFGWRFAGTLFGVLMLPILYHILKRLFGNSFLCTAGTLLFAFDFMHFTQTRIATIDTYSVFFLLLMYDAMLVFFQKDFREASKKSLLLPLGLCGLFMGMGIASKWTCAYGAVGLAVLFFTKLVKEHKRTEEKALYFKNALHLCLWCMLFFIVIPFGIYFAAFLPLTTLPDNRSDILGRFFSYQTTMFNYHSGLKGEHAFASPWYEWPLDLRNIWYAITNNFEGSGAISTISCFGNPLLWWSGLAAMVTTFVLFLKERASEPLFIIIGFFSAYLPWLLISRLTFVYHYFTAVPFIVMALCYCMDYMMSLHFMRRPMIKNGMLAQVNTGTLIISVFVLAVLSLFVLFFPVISGSPSTTDYV
ncbi:MAG: glycosyltransferase family 39 protein, partial [Oscillospiraceae bacterium]